jgi:hypothetical protein
VEKFKMGLETMPCVAKQQAFMLGITPYPTPSLRLLRKQDFPVRQRLSSAKVSFYQEKCSARAWGFAAFVWESAGA